MYSVRKILFRLCSVFNDLLFLDMVDKHLQSGAFRLPTQISKAENKHHTCWGVWLDNIDGRVIRGDNRESDNSNVSIVPGTSYHTWVNCFVCWIIKMEKKERNVASAMQQCTDQLWVFGKVLEISCTFCL